MSTLDDCFTDLDRDEIGLAHIGLADGRGRSLSFWVDDTYPYVMVFTGDLPEIGRKGLAVEPMTCAPNAFRSGVGLVTLGPGDSHTATWGITTRLPGRRVGN